MESYFRLDPLLHYIFVFLAPESEFSEVCKVISPCITLAYLLFQATNTQNKRVSVALTFLTANFRKNII
jgi:hypothetical protein